MDTETYEVAVRRAVRRWPYRTPAWPCPACGKAERDLDVFGEKVGSMTWVYRHVPTPESEEGGTHDA